jgi:hypothetical protein
MILGIVGSSYSTGNHPMADGTTTGFFETDIKEFLGGEIPVYNAAQGGHGSEKYLNTILYLWHNYKITHCIIEYIEDRSLMSGRYRNDDWYEKKLHKIDTAWERNKAKSTHTLMYQNKWQKKINESYDNTSRLEWWTRNNMLQAVQLCNALNINIIMWKMHNYRDPSNKNINEVQNKTIELIQKQWKDRDCWVSFGGHQWARDFFIDKYGLRGHVCADGVHLSKQCQKENAKVLAEKITKQYME